MWNCWLEERLSGLPKKTEKLKVWNWKRKKSMLAILFYAPEEKVIQPPGQPVMVMLGQKNLGTPSFHPPQPWFLSWSKRIGPKICKDYRWEIFAWVFFRITNNKILALEKCCSLILGLADRSPWIWVSTLVVFWKKERLLHKSIWNRLWISKNSTTGCKEISRKVQRKISKITCLPFYPKN